MFTEEGFVLVSRPKVLRRIHAAPKRSFLEKLGETTQKTFLGEKKVTHMWPDRPAQSKMEKILSYITPIMPSNAEEVADMIQNLKLKIPAALGIAGVAALIYIAYKIYKANQRGDLDEAKRQITEGYNHMMAHLKSKAGDLLKLPGWIESVSKSVAGTLSTGKFADIVRGLLDIESKVTESQRSMTGSVGAGLLHPAFRSIASARTGGGYAMPVY